VANALTGVAPHCFGELADPREKLIAALRHGARLVDELRRQSPVGELPLEQLE
jgi:hypothetical protein